MSYYTSDSSDGESEAVVEYNEDNWWVLEDIEQNSPNVKKFEIYPSYKVPPPDDFIPLGTNIGNNTRLTYFHLCGDGLEDDDEIASKESLEAFCEGFSRNGSLKNVLIEHFNFHRANLATLHPFVVNNDNLSEMQLHSCKLEAADLEQLADAFRRRSNPSSITTIGIGGPSITDDSTHAIARICDYCPQLETLDLSQSRIGDRGAQELSGAVTDNETLKNMYLDGNPQITPGFGWFGFYLALGDNVSINATYQSNHTLEKLGKGDDDRTGLPAEVMSLLQLNRGADKTSVARKKIFHNHLGDNFEVTPFLDMLCSDMEEKLLPSVLGWIGKDWHLVTCEDQRTRLSTFFQIVQNVPSICSFSIVSQLRAENASLKADNASLRHENEELKRQIEKLLSQK
ncbi:hypothetical protein ACHAXT_011058 [Thalassiosira profunda]